MKLAALDDLQHPGAGPGDDGRHLRTLVSAIDEDRRDEGEQAPGAPVEHVSRAVTILDRGGMDRDVQEEAERIDEDMALAARDLLARIVALRIDRRPPFAPPGR